MSESTVKQIKHHEKKNYIRLKDHLEIHNPNLKATWVCDVNFPQAEV